MVAVLKMGWWRNGLGTLRKESRAISAEEEHPPGVWAGMHFTGIVALVPIFLLIIMVEQCMDAELQIQSSLPPKRAEPLHSWLIQ